MTTKDNIHSISDSDLDGHREGASVEGRVFLRQEVHGHEEAREEVLGEEDDSEAVADEEERGEEERGEEERGDAVIRQKFDREAILR